MDRTRRNARAPIKVPQLIVPLPEPKTEEEPLVTTKNPSSTTRPARVYKRKMPPDVEGKAKSLTTTGPPIDHEKTFKILMQSSKSQLVSMDMNDIINANTWKALSEDAKSHLKTLLPPTAFTAWQETLGEDHPALDGLCMKLERATRGNGTRSVDTTLESVKDQENAMAVDVHSLPQSMPSNSNICSTLNFIPDSLIPTLPRSSYKLAHPFFTDSHFHAALHTFQDHLYLNFFSDTHRQKSKEYQEGIISGKLAAPWKDEVWEHDNPASIPSVATELVPAGSGSGALSGALAVTLPKFIRSGASQVKLNVLAKNKVIRIGDVIAYKRYFSLLDIVVEKDVIIQSIHSKTHEITILTPRGTTKSLPKYLLSSSMDVNTDSSSKPATLSVTINSPTMLETALLNIDARVGRSRRPNGNAWKAFNVYRYRAGVDYNPYDDRGGRELYGALFYLRAEYYSENY